MEIKLVTLVTFALTLLLCSSGSYSSCPYSTASIRHHSTTCNAKVHDCDKFVKECLAYANKLKPYFDKVQSKRTLTASEVTAAKKIVLEYYTYLQSKNIIYGKAAKDVVNNNGVFGRIAIAHLRHSAKVAGKSDSQVNDIQNNLYVALAYSDAKLRSECKGYVPYSQIAKYHYDSFKHQGLPKVAWGGCLMEEFAGDGSWMNFGGYDKTPSFTYSTLIKAILTNQQANGIKARDALSAIKHIFKSHLGDALHAGICGSLGVLCDV